MATFSDAQLIAIVIKAARRINRRLDLNGTDDEIVVSGTTGEITSPDDDALDDLVMLQAECMIASRQFSEELTDGTAGISMKDGEQSLDTRARGVARGTFFDSPHGPCEELKQAIILEKISRSTGRLIW